MSITSADRSVRTALGRIDDNLEEALGLLGLLAYTGIILYNVVLRVTMGEQTTWRQAAVIGLFVWVAWITGAMIVRERSHLRFTLLYDRLSNRGQYAMAWIEWALWLAFAGGVLQEAIQVFRNYVQSGGLIVGTSLPIWLVYLSIPAGFSLIILRVLQQMVVVTRKYRAGEDIAAETDIET